MTKTRYVTTPEGAKYYGLPIGSPITRDVEERAEKKHGAPPAKEVSGRSRGSGSSVIQRAISSPTGNSAISYHITSNKQLEVSSETHRVVLSPDLQKSLSHRLLQGDGSVEDAPRMHTKSPTWDKVSPEERLDYEKQEKDNETKHMAEIDKQIEDGSYEEERQVTIVSNALYQKNKALEDAITTEVESVLSGSGLTTLGNSSRLQPAKSIASEIEKRVNDTGLSAKEAAASIDNVLSYDVVSSASDLISKMKAVFDEFKARGHMVKKKNVWQAEKEGTYMVTRMTSSSGHSFVISFHTPDSLRVQEINGALYTAVSKLPAGDPRRAAIVEQMKKNASLVDATAVVSEVSAS